MNTVYRSRDCDTNEALAILYLGFSEAFDKVLNWKLIEKVEQTNIVGSLPRRIASNLSNRQQYVEINSEKSEELNTNEVAQGSILGPILFLNFFKDFPKNLSEMSCGYADDLK